MYTERRADREGVRNGRKWRWMLFPPAWPPWGEKDPYPPKDKKDAPEFENRMYKVAKGELSKIAEEWAGRDKGLRNACAEAEAVYRKDESDVKTQSGDHAGIVKEYEVAKASLDGFDRPLVSKWIHYPVLLVIFASEAFFNSMILNILGQNRMDTWMIAVGLVLAIPICAEFAGAFLRRENKSIDHKMWIGITIIIVLAALIGITVLREKFFEASGMAQALGISLSASTFDFVFLGFNILIFTASVLLAFWSAPKDPEGYANALGRFKDAAVALKNTGRDLQESAEKLMQARINFERSHIVRDREHEKRYQQAKMRMQICATVIHAYRDGNVAARGGETPDWFENAPEDQFEIPTTLAVLDCSGCPYPDLKVNGTLLPDKDGGDPPPQDNAPVLVPVLITEQRDLSLAEAHYNQLIGQSGLAETIPVLKSRGFSSRDLTICLTGTDSGKLRTSENPKLWKDAWRELLDKWNQKDAKLHKSFPAGFSYHLFPQVVLPIAFALGAAVGKRRPLSIYHEQTGTVFKAFDLITNPRDLFKNPLVNIPAPVIKELVNGETKCILHLIASDNHLPEFDKHPDWQTATNVSLLYELELPSGDWLSYAQHLYQDALPWISRFEQVDLCLAGPAALFFALGMAFSLKSKITVCHWFGQGGYRPVFSLKDVHKLLGKVF